MNNAMTKADQQGLAATDSTGYGILTVEQIINQTQQINSLMSQGMTESVHYGRIPGCGSKPTLLQPGAQKLMLMFGLADTYEIACENLPNGHREYTVTCNLVSKATGLLQGSGNGLCSTMESKYRYRKRSGKREENPDIADTYNTVLKMACKRALVAAVLNSLAASDMFTQDVEDNPSQYQQQGYQQQRQPAPTPQQAPPRQPDPLDSLRRLMQEAKQYGLAPADLTDTVERALGRKMQDLNQIEISKAQAIILEQIELAKSPAPVSYEPEPDQYQFSDEDIEF